ncbi:hypothetical protein B0H19DRAFT_1076031 [Mycena capillaripes]|nr:hypothetical protein B0H19DRAFT_1076031 [Mycena capillaripes]
MRFWRLEGVKCVQHSQRMFKIAEEGVRARRIHPADERAHNALNKPPSAKAMAINFGISEAIGAVRKRGRNDLSSDRPISGVVSGAVSANLVMPAATRRSERATKLLKSFIRNNKGHQRRALLRRRAAHRARLDNPLPPHPFGIDLDLRCGSSDSDTSSDSFSSSSEDSASTSDSHWSDIMGPDWRFMAIDVDFSITELDDIFHTTTSSSSRESATPDLFSVSSGSESDSFRWNWSSGDDADDEDSDEDSDDMTDRAPLLRRWVRAKLSDMYEHRYEEPRDTLPRGMCFLGCIRDELTHNLSSNR